MQHYECCEADIVDLQNRHCRAMVAGFARNLFKGASVDLADGFIHFSAAHQVRETAAKHFSGQSDLLLVAVDTATLGEALRWEVSRGGDRFPHLYTTLEPRRVVWVRPLPLDAQGAHDFAGLLS